MPRMLRPIFRRFSCTASCANVSLVTENKYKGTPAPPEGPSGGGRRGMEKQVKILVVDGSRVLRRVMQAALVRHLGSDRLRIYVAGTAEEALARLNDERFDLITSALQLPEMNGIELCRQLRRTPSNRFTPFVVVTAEPHQRHMREGYSAGVTDYFDKTRGVQEFTNFVRGLVDRYAALSGRILYIEDNDLDAAY